MENNFKIHLYNRDGANLKLVSEDGELWTFDVDERHQYILDYCRVGFEQNDPNKYVMIDPSGVPYLEIGQRLDKTHVINEIVKLDKGFGIKTIEKEA